MTAANFPALASRWTEAQKNESHDRDGNFVSFYGLNHSPKSVLIFSRMIASETQTAYKSHSILCVPFLKRFFLFGGKFVFRHRCNDPAVEIQNDTFPYQPRAKCLLAPIRKRKHTTCLPGKQHTRPMRTTNAFRNQHKCENCWGKLQDTESILQHSVTMCSGEVISAGHGRTTHNRILRMNRLENPVGAGHHLAVWPLCARPNINLPSQNQFCGHRFESSSATFMVCTVCKCSLIETRRAIKFWNKTNQQMQLVCQCPCRRTFTHTFGMDVLRIFFAKHAYALGLPCVVSMCVRANTGQILDYLCCNFRVRKWNNEREIVHFFRGQKLLRFPDTARRDVGRMKQ